MYLVGDYENGKTYGLENEVYTDAGDTIADCAEPAT
jgi:hypothetical protein